MRRRRAVPEAELPTALDRVEAARWSSKYDLSLTILFGVAAALFFTLAVIGTVRNYSPVPFGDMWDDYIGFYLRVHAGQWGAWWAQHNEHRIVLARLFFWIDIVYFHGNGIFSLAVIYMFALAVGLVLALIWREQCKKQDLYILFFVEAWIFSWSQRENLTWAFQSQFILAQLLPLAALYFLHLSSSKPHREKIYFWAATLCGVLAVGSMANGVLALPAMSFYVFFVTKNFRRAAFLGAASVCEIYFYFQHLTSSPIQGAAPTLTGEIFAHPPEFIVFVLMYLGSPFIFLFNKTGFLPEAICVGVALAALLILVSAWALYKNLRRAERATLPLALLVFIFYIVASAAITAAGRLPLGLKQALASRYLTPALYGWAAALLLFWPVIAKSNRIRKVFPVILTIFLCFIMLPRQLQALSVHQDMLVHRAFAALTLALQINDADQIDLLYPRPDVALEIADRAREQHLSIFGFAPLKDAHLLLGKKAKFATLIHCRGDLERIDATTGNSQYVRIKGWLFNSRQVRSPELVYLVNQENEIVGLGFVGERRADIARLEGRGAVYSGFQAYLSTDALGQYVSILSPSNACELPLVKTAIINLQAPAFLAAPGN